MTDADAESASKDRFYERLSALADEMIEAHGKDFTMGSLILSRVMRASAMSRVLELCN